jgi:hypothetical protein
MAVQDKISVSRRIIGVSGVSSYDIDVSGSKHRSESSLSLWFLLLFLPVPQRRNYFFKNAAGRCYACFLDQKNQHRTPHQSRFLFHGRNKVGGKEVYLKILLGYYTPNNGYF